MSVAVAANDTRDVGFAFTHVSRVVAVSEPALGRIAECLFAEHDYAALVLTTKKGGCSGNKYVMSIATRETYTNPDAYHVLSTIERGGQLKSVVVNNDSLMFLAGMTIDYVESETGGGFLFTNPNAVSSCGCGESFKVKDSDG
jgi:iron-sulfur cluster assembly protein